MAKGAPEGGAERDEAVAASDSRLGMLLLAVGFFWFGFALSWTAGLTKQPGSGIALLTGFFSFVGGTFLSFAGFRRKDRAQPTIDSMRLGGVLVALSLGVVLGGPCAFLARAAYGTRNGSVPLADASSPEGKRVGAESFGFPYQSGADSACGHIGEALRYKNPQIVASSVQHLLSACADSVAQCKGHELALLTEGEALRKTFCSGQDGR